MKLNFTTSISAFIVLLAISGPIIRAGVWKDFAYEMWNGAVSGYECAYHWCGYRHYCNQWGNEYILGPTHPRNWIYRDWGGVPYHTTMWISYRWVYVDSWDPYGDYMKFYWHWSHFATYYDTAFWSGH